MLVANAIAPASSPSSYSAAILADSPQVYWRLGESSGTTAADSSGNAVTGTYSATGVTYGQAGAVSGDTAVSLNGSASIQSTATFTTTTATLECWVKLSSLPVTNPYFVIGRPASDGSGTVDKVLSVTTAGKVDFYVFDGGPAKHATGATTLTTGVWHYLVGTTDGANAIVYLDGQQDGSVAAGTSFSSATILEVAGRATSPGYDRLNGGADEAAMYSTALSSSRVAAHYGAGVTVFRSGGLAAATALARAASI